MKKSMLTGILLIVAGAACMSLGAYVIWKGRQPVAGIAEAPGTATMAPQQQMPQDTAAVPETPTERPEAEAAGPDNWEKGKAFEGHVIKLFDRQYFSVKEWRADKYVDGVFAEANLYPDIEMVLSAKGGKHRFALECKWRKSFYRDGIEWATEKQMANYARFAKEKALPVFVVIGVGGQPDAPAELYVLPLEQAKYPVLYTKTLARYRKETGKTFYYDPSERSLR